MNELSSSPIRYLDLGAGVRLIEVDNAPVNALSTAVRAGLLHAVQAAQSDDTVRALVIACAGKTFIAGADIREFGKPDQPPSLPQVIAVIEASPKPVVAAMQGTALGGGLEVAMGCHARLASAEASMGLPEVNLGLMPGAGGTQRLPRLIGMKAALDMILSGKPIKAQRAKEAGLIDAIVTADLRTEAAALAADLAARLAAGSKVRRTGELPCHADSAVDFDTEQKRVASRMRGQPAPLAILRVLRAAPGGTLEAGLKTERSEFLELRASPESAALRYAFFAERSRSGRAKGDGARDISLAAVIGAGTMGQGIAIALAESGVPVRLIEPDEAARERARNALDRYFQGQSQRDPAAAERALSAAKRIDLLGQIVDARAADLFIEAVFEDLAVKRTVFKQIEAIAAPDAILASNTSYLDLDAIAGALQRPNNFLGLHFFSPAQLMKLLEVVRASTTSEQSLATGLALGRRLGKVAIPMRNGYGFAGNRMLARRTREAYFLLEEGAMPWDVDRVLQEFGFPMGPFRVGDLAGLDIGWRNRQARLDQLTARERACTILDQLVERGRLGQKSGRGFYQYDAQRKPTPDREVEELIRAHGTARGIEPRTISAAEILERCLYPMINEAALIIDEGIVERPDDVDLVWLHGYGFPRFRGGPLYWADRVGLSNIVASMEAYGARLGSEFWEPAPGLRRRAAQGKGLLDLPTQ